MTERATNESAVDPAALQTPPPVITALPATSERERRVAMTPESAEKLIAMGWSCVVPAGVGERAGYADTMYADAGVTVVGRMDEAVASAVVVLCVEPPETAILNNLRADSLLVGLISPFTAHALIEAAASKRVSCIAMELVPRSTIAQPMDALSSQASLAGYAAVLRAGDRLPRVLPMMSTPAGTIPPARVLVVGTGVAGLQAIATAVRLGARVSAYDVRPVAKEQVESLGARFLTIETEEAGETADGYAKAQTDEQLAKQRRGLADICAASDVIITTAQIFGRPAPKIIDSGMIAGMKPGSVIIDAAIATGGNVEGSAAGEETIVDGVTLIADAHLPSAVATEASRMFASNIVSLLTHVLPNGPASELLPDDNEILASVLVTNHGCIRDTLATKASAGATNS